MSSIFAILVLFLGAIGFFFRKSTIFSRYLGIRWINRRNRGVRRRGKLSEAKILENVRWEHNLMISGCSIGRSFLLRQLAGQLHREGVPVVILHRGNKDLENMIAGLNLPGTVICNASNRLYDPLKDHEPDDIPDMLLDNETAAKKGLNASSKGYIRAIAQMYYYGGSSTLSIRSLEAATDVGGNPPRGFTALLQRVDELTYQKQTLDPGRAQGIVSLLKMHQHENTNVHDYALSLLRQFSSCMPQKGDKLKDQSYVNIYRNAIKKGILCLDLNAVTDAESAYSAVFSEFEDHHIGTNYIIMDEIEIGKSPALSNWISSGQFTYCISCESIQNILPKGNAGQDGGAAFLHSLADGCQMHILFKQPLGAAEMWSRYYNEYRKKQVTMQIAKDKGMAVSDGTESIVRPEELSTGMGNANIFVFSTLEGKKEFYQGIIKPDEY